MAESASAQPTQPKGVFRNKRWFLNPALYMVVRLRPYKPLGLRVTQHLYLYILKYLTLSEEMNNYRTYDVHIAVMHEAYVSQYTVTVAVYLASISLSSVSTSKVDNSTCSTPDRHGNSKIEMSSRRRAHLDSGKSGIQNQKFGIRFSGFQQEG